MHQLQFSFNHVPNQRQMFEISAARMINHHAIARAEFGVASIG